MPSFQSVSSRGPDRPHPSLREPALPAVPGPFEADFVQANRLDADPVGARPMPTRVIEVGAVTAGIAVPEGGRVRFFSSSRAFDGLDGTLFHSPEQAARAARAFLRPVPRRA